MVFKNFKINCIIRIFLIAAALFITIYLFLKSNLILVPSVFLIIAIFQVYLLIRYIENLTGVFEQFLESIKYSDFSLRYKVKDRGKPFEKLYDLVREVSEKYQTAQFEKEEQYRYLDSVIEHLQVGLISFLDDGNVDFINLAAKKILNIQRLKNINDLKSLDKKLVSLLFKMDSNEKDLIKIKSEGDVLNLLIHIKKFRLKNQYYSLAAIYNIQKELEEKEIESWENLFKVLTHEIMNSVTPIASLASSIRDLIENESNHTAKKTAKADSDMSLKMIDAVQTIQRRSEGLLQFVNSYRSFMRIPKPIFATTSLLVLFERVEKLMHEKLMNSKIHFFKEVDPENLKAVCDPNLIEQVLINLILNSIWAVKDTKNPKIQLLGKLDRDGKVLIEVIDNGSGIDKEIMDKIFLPFFTTRRGGSGIGLSLSKQIMRLHNGTIIARSGTGDGCTIRLKF